MAQLEMTRPPCRGGRRRSRQGIISCGGWLSIIFGAECTPALSFRQSRRRRGISGCCAQWAALDRRRWRSLVTYGSVGMTGLRTTIKVATSVTRPIHLRIELEPVLALFLGAVHRKVGMFHQRLL